MMSYKCSCNASVCLYMYLHVHVLNDLTIKRVIDVTDDVHVSTCTASTRA